MTSETETKMKVGLRRYKRTALPLIISSMIITTLILAMTFFDQLPWIITIDSNTKTLSLENRLIFTLQLLFIDLFPLLITIFAVINRRITSIAINPMNPKGHALVEQRQRILQNTLEQLIIKLILSFTLCTVLRSNELLILPVFTILFVIGRFAFALGYPNYRSFGFIMNLTSTVFVIILIGYRLFIEGALFQYIEQK
jgi:hypothetical protein